MDFAGPVNIPIRVTRLPGEQIKNEGTNSSQNVPSIARVATGAFGFLIFNHAFDGPDLYGALSFFETIPSTPKTARGSKQPIADRDRKAS